MLSINHFGSGDAAKRYYSEHLSKGDYYAKDAELLQPKYEGLTAKMLGVEGQAVTQKSFFDLVDNKHPETGKQLTERMRSDRRSMTDLTFNVPKTVAVASIVDHRVNAAIEESVDETMREIETSVCVRVRKGGADHDRETGNLIYVKWGHKTTRPLADGTVDPHPHVHVTVANVSYDPVEKQFKATQFGNVVRDKGYYQAAYHARLAEKLSKLGYGVEREQKSFRLVGIDKAVTDKFSRRQDVINKAAEVKGITSAEGRDRLAKSTRNKKTDELGSEELTKEWMSRMTPAEMESLYRAGKGEFKTKPKTAKDAMDWAVEHSFERKSVITEKKLLEEALIHGVGSVTVEGVHGQLPGAEVIKKEKAGVKYVTTKKVYQEELDMVAFARDGKGKFPRLRDDIPGSVKGPEIERPERILSDEQAFAMQKILSSRDRVTVLIGDAGAGKTYMMQETVKAIESTGTTVNTFAPSASASRGVLREENFPNADTIEMLLTNEKVQQRTAGQVIWVDEAGLISSPDMNRLFALAKRNDNRLILSGDTKQHRAVQRGDGLRILIKEAGLKPATLSDIHRQKSASYKDAVKSIAKGDLEAGFKKLDAMGAIVESETRYEEIAKEYVAAVTGKKTALVVTPTHREAAKVTETIRERLKAKGRLAGNEETLNTLYAVNMTVAERKDPLNYTPGMVVQFHQKCKGFERGEKAEVLQADGGRCTVNSGGKVKELPLALAERFQVYQKTSIAVAPGESIRVTKNGRLKNKGKEFRPNNGDVYKVAGFAENGDLQLSNGSVIPKDYGHLAYGYTSTSHASQGKTVDKVFISMSEDSLSAANREQFYVSVSRGRESVKLYTDDKQAVMEAVEKSGQRMSATELLGMQKEKVIELDRVRRAYTAIKERTKDAITQIKEKVHDRRRTAG